MKERTIHISFAVEDYFNRYCQYTATAMVSIMENTKSKIMFHILHDHTMTGENRTKFQSLVSRYGQDIAFYPVSAGDRFNLNERGETTYSDGIMFRLWLPELLDAAITRVIYLDSDMLINLDIERLWDIPIGGYSAAAVKDFYMWEYWDGAIRGGTSCEPYGKKVPGNCYFNSGVMVLNLETIRKKHDLVGESRDFFTRYHFRFPDQDALNMILRNEVYYLPGEFNTFITPAETITAHKIFHFQCLGDFSPLNEFDRFFISYWEKTPWGRDLSPREQKILVSAMKGKLSGIHKLKERRKFTGQNELDYGRELYYTGKFRESAEYLQGVLASESDPGLYRTKRQYLLKSLWEAGECASYERMLLEDTDNPDTAYLLGELYMKRKEYRKAETAYSLFLQGAGDASDTEQKYTAFQRLSKCAAKSGNYQAAFDYNEQARALHPERTAVQLNAVFLRKLLYDRQ
jgi:lipopolysaccharide biosynthesis glycosyltransferase